MSYYNEKFMEEIKEELSNRKSRIVRRSETCLTILSSTQNSSDQYDQAQNEEIEELLVNINNRDYLLLDKINLALDKFMSNSYGLCEACGERIPEKRLRVEPTATMCIECKEDDERQYRAIAV